jgi:histidinol dehydrogenase
MIRTVDCTEEDVFALLRGRGPRRDAGTQQVVHGIVEAVRTRGDAALLESARAFDAPDLTSIVVSDQEIESADLPAEHEAALHYALDRILAFHKRQAEALFRGWSGVRADPDRRGADERLGDRLGPGIFQWGSGVGTPLTKSPFRVREGTVGQRAVPVQRAGVYVPGGLASYPSSVLMNVGPANVARVPEVFVTTPAMKDGTLPPSVLVALRESSVTRGFKIGGAAAIAALGLGTESVPRVDKIVGPGNRYVNEAKRQLWGSVGLDGYAGPSEVCVLADSSANAAFAAADFLTQLEHAEDNTGFLVVFSAEDLNRIMAEVWEQVRTAPREKILRQALGGSFGIIAHDLDHACEIIDEIAPEHLTIMTSDPERAAGRIRNAGCILLGDQTPESAADWAIGPSHTLPTAGGARFGSPVNVLDFIKFQSISRLTRSQLGEMQDSIDAFAEMEGFPEHGRAAKLRYTSDLE